MYILWIGIILGVLILSYYGKQLHRKYHFEAQKGIQRTQSLEKSMLTESDIQHLPKPVQKYLQYTNVLGKEKAYSFKVDIEGSMKIGENRDWTKVSVEQYSFLDEMTRLFFLRLKMKGLPIVGLHYYIQSKAVMLIKLCGVIPVANGQGPEMDQAETVTVLNDMCILAPSALIDKRIQWEEVDDTTAKAIFNNKGIQITAVLYFNADGQLVNFISDDRYYSPTGKTFEQARWATPVSDYKNINGFNLPTYGEAIWQFKDRELCYAKYHIRNVVYNTD